MTITEFAEKMTELAKHVPNAIVVFMNNETGQVDPVTNWVSGEDEVELFNDDID